MSHFLRQFHLISSFKSNPDKELLPFYKVIAPILSKHPTVRKIQTQSIGRSIRLKTIDPNTKEKKKLAVIWSWMLAKDVHIEKYRSIYLSRGFDVLTIDVAPKDLLFPTSGTQVIALNILEYLSAHKEYEKVLMHAFSVGGYMMGEMFVKMRDNVDKYMNLSKRISGVILDSAVDFEGIPTGLPRAISRNPLTIKVLEWYVSSHLALMFNVATKHYIRSSKHFHNTPLRCPALMFVSEADKIGNPAANQLVAENWQIRGVDVKMKAFKDSKHVSHMHKYQQEYVAEIDEFLKKVDLVPSSKL